MHRRPVNVGGVDLVLHGACFRSGLSRPLPAADRQPGVDNLQKRQAARAFKGFPSGHGAALPAIMARLERTPMRCRHSTAAPSLPGEWAIPARECGL
jgi:hypothetical protein